MISEYALQLSDYVQYIKQPININTEPNTLGAIIILAAGAGAALWLAHHFYLKKNKEIIEQIEHITELAVDIINRMETDDAYAQRVEAQLKKWELEDKRWNR